MFSGKLYNMVSAIMKQKTIPVKTVLQMLQYSVILALVLRLLAQPS